MQDDNQVKDDSQMPGGAPVEPAAEPEVPATTPEPMGTPVTPTPVEPTTEGHTEDAPAGEEKPEGTDMPQPGQTPSEVPTEGTGNQA